jgi:DNA-binding NarL/FixJ family response regulator
MFVKHRPRVVALGLTVHRGSGIQLIKDSRRLNGAARILVVSARDDPLSIQRAFRAATHGYIALEDDSSRMAPDFLYASAESRLVVAPAPIH